MRKITIKNDSGSTQTVLGKVLSDQSTIEIDTYAKLESFRKDSVLMQLVSSQDLIVCNEEGDITSVSDALAWIYQDNPSEVKMAEAVETSGVKDPKGMRARLVGIINKTVTKSTVDKIDWLCPQLQYAGVNKNSYFDGIQYYAKDAEMGDKATFQVVDKDGTGVTLGLYPQAYYDAYKDGDDVLVVEEFGTDWYMIPNNMEDLMLYKARILPGLYIRMIYTSTGTTDDVKLVVNLFRHLDGS